MITHVDVISIEPYLTSIDKLIIQTSELCIKLRPNDFYQCKDILNPTEILLQANYAKSQSLSHIISGDAPSRFKRSLEFGGEVLKFFFGTLDAEDARKYDSAIHSCQKSESELYQLMKDNIHVVQSSITSFNSTIYKLNQNEQKLNSQIDKLNVILSQVAHNNNEMIYISRLNNLVNIIEGSLLAISNLLDSIINSILFAKANILHPAILTPTNLYNELAKNSHLINKRLDFPVSLTIQNIHTLIDISKLTSYYYKNKIVFVIQIPLISPIKFIVYKVIPLPTPHDTKNPNTFALIHPTKAYIALTEDNLNYVTFDDMKDCIVIQNDYSICPPLSVFSSTTNPSCETRLLTEVVLSLPKECNSKLLYGQVDIWQRLNNNRWIFVQSKNNKLTVKCGDKIKDHVISGTGTVKLSEDCVGYSKTIQLLPSTSHTITVQNQLRLDFVITEDNCCKKEIFNKTLSSLSPISISNIDLDSLKHASHQLNNLENEINKAQNESHIVKYGTYYSTVTYFIIVTIFIYAFYKLYRYCKSNDVPSCCIKIYNQCNNKRSVKHQSKISNSIEMSDISNSSEEEKKSVRSLPEPSRRLNLRKYESIQSINRNLSNN